jgi:uncharacterized membrane protein YgcG
VRRRVVSTLIPALLWAFAAAAPALAQEQPPTQVDPASPAPAPGQLVEVSGVALAAGGKPVEAAPPGVTVTLTLTLRNGGTDPLTNVKATLADPQDGVHLIDKQATFGSMAPGATADGAFSFSIEADKCTDFLGFGGEATYDGGSTPIKVGVPAACPGPRLGVQGAEFEGGDGDGVPEPGETLKMFILLGNDGNDPATNVHATVTVAGDGVSAAPTSVSWPDIAAHSSARSITPVVVTIASDAPTQKGCPGGGGPVPVADATAPPDQAVSSDGTTSSGGSSGGGGSSSTGTGSSSFAGSTPGSEPGSPGTGEPVIVDPVPPNASVKPAPDASTEPGGGGSVEPQPFPVPPAGTPEPQPAQQDPSALVSGKLSVDATGYHVDLEYSNQVFCALEGGAKDGAVAPQYASRTGGTHSQSHGGAAVPVGAAILVSAVAVGARKVFVR